MSTDSFAFKEPDLPFVIFDASGVVCGYFATTDQAHAMKETWDERFVDDAPHLVFVLAAVQKADPYTTTEESESVMGVDTRTPAEKLVDKMLADGGAFEHGVEFGVIERRVAVKLAEQNAELLKALKELLDQDDHGDDEIWVRNEARAVIAKAEGSL